MRNFLLFLCLLATPVWAKTASQELVQLLKDVDTFRANFEQRLVSPKGTVIQEVKGLLKAKRPGLFYWYTLPPLEQTIVTDGEKVWMYDPDLEQVTIQNLSHQLSNTPALLLSGEVTDIERHYKVKNVTTEKDKQSYLLEPKSQESLFVSLYLSFHNQQLTLMQLKDSLGQETTLKFFKQGINRDVDDSDFHFEIPEGIDVIRE